MILELLRISDKVEVSTIEITIKVYQIVDNCMVFKLASNVLEENIMVVIVDLLHTVADYEG